MWKRAFLLVMLVASCVKRVNVCNTNADCQDPAFPFCDVNGEFPESGGEKNTCTIIPPECPVERCGCTSGASRCDADQLVTCNSDGMSETTTACELGCSAANQRCLTFEPLNVASQLGGAVSEPDIVLPSGTHIDTGTGVVTNAAQLPIQINSVIVTQGATAIRVFLAKSLVINDVTISGGNAFAVVTYGTLTVQGRVDASANFNLKGPGSAPLAAPCTGATASPGGGGGGGNATVGASGGLDPVQGLVSAPGGMAQSTFSPLVGGCNGGNAGTDGGGGGAVELVSQSSIIFANTGLIYVGGGGGAPIGGGGSGGNVILEAPHVSFQTATSGVAANGGGGGACADHGANGTTDSTPAVGAGPCGPNHDKYLGGNGGTSVTPATAGFTGSGVGGNGAGGGGAVGRLLIMTKDGTYGMATGPILSALVTSDVIAPK